MVATMFVNSTSNKSIPTQNDSMHLIYQCKLFILMLTELCNAFLSGGKTMDFVDGKNTNMDVRPAVQTCMSLINLNEASPLTPSGRETMANQIRANYVCTTLSLFLYWFYIYILYWYTCSIKPLSSFSPINL